MVALTLDDWEKTKTMQVLWHLFVLVLSLWCTFISCKSQYCWALLWRGGPLQTCLSGSFEETRSTCRKRTLFPRGNVNPQLPLNAVKELKYRALTMAIWNMWTGLMRGQKPSKHVRNKICPATRQFHKLNPFLRKCIYHSPFPQWETIVFILFALPFSFSFSPSQGAVLCLCGPHSYLL